MKKNALYSYIYYYIKLITAQRTGTTAAAAGDGVNSPAFWRRARLCRNVYNIVASHNNIHITHCTHPIRRFPAPGSTKYLVANCSHVPIINSYVITLTVYYYYLRFFLLLRKSLVEIQTFVFQIRTYFTTVNYLAYNFSENIFCVTYYFVYQG